MELAEGCLVVLPRDEAKQFFGHRQDEPRLEFIHELLGNDGIQRCGCNSQWQAIHDALSGVELANSVLGQAILGGRPLHQGDDYHVLLVRPDVVAFIAQQLNDVDLSELGELADLAREIHATYQAAADVGGAMVFVAKR